jgi:hypothetical protein
MVVNRARAARSAARFSPRLSTPSRMSQTRSRWRANLKEDVRDGLQPEVEVLGLAPLTSGTTKNAPGGDSNSNLAGALVQDE